jgi:Alr-MurF fusion protein
LLPLYTVEEIAKIVGGTIYGMNPLTEIQHVSVDTRSLVFPKNTLFFALKTKKNDGHRYVSTAHKRGLACAVVSEKIDETGTYILVSDTLEALQKVAVFHRNHFNIPVIGITGSNGKTIVKEWIDTILKSKYVVCKNPKSFNSQIGVPLSIWNLKTHHDMGVFEAGISMPFEMNKLEQIIKPNIGVFTYLGDAHQFYFSSSNEKLMEKLQLFQNCHTVIAPDYQKEVVEAIQSLNTQAFLWGKSENAALQVENLESTLLLKYQNQTYLWENPPKESFLLGNILTAWCVGLVMGMEMNEIGAVIQKAPSPSIRIAQLAGISQNQLFVDYFNSDLDSLSALLSYSNSHYQNLGKVLIWSDLAEKYADVKSLYEKVDTLLKYYQIDIFIGIGNQFLAHSFPFSVETHLYQNVDDFLSQYPFYQWKNRQINLKGTARFQFEKIVHRLQFKTHQTRLEVNLKHMVDNLNFIKDRLPKNTHMMAMVKAFSYGSGDYQVAKTLQNSGVSMLGVAYLDEGLDLRKAGISLPIMVLNPDLEVLDIYVENNLQPVIFSANSFLKILDYKGADSLHIHLEADTGMHRLGFYPSELPSIAKILKGIKNINVASIFSHLAAADDHTQDDFTQNQICQYKEMCLDIQEILGYPVIKHIANTSGILRFPDSTFDMVRLGLGLYGISPIFEKSDLKPVGTFKSYITQIKDISGGEGVGYGRHSFSQKPRKIAVVAVGYADGFDRRFSQGKGKFLINGKYALILGNVCMDMTMCDVTNIECNEGDEVVIFNDQLTVSELAKNIGTIPYEILTNVSERVSRIFLME